MLLAIVKFIYGRKSENASPRSFIYFGDFFFFFFSPCDSFLVKLTREYSHIVVPFSDSLRKSEHPLISSYWGILAPGSCPDLSRAGEGSHPVCFSGLTL